MRGVLCLHPRGDVFIHSQRCENARTSAELLRWTEICVFGRARVRYGVTILQPVRAEDEQPATSTEFQRCVIAMRLMAQDHEKSKTKTPISRRESHQPTDGRTDGRTNERKEQEHEASSGSSNMKTRSPEAPGFSQTTYLPRALNTMPVIAVYVRWQTDWAWAEILKAMKPEARRGKLVHWQRYVECGIVQIQ